MNLAVSGIIPGKLLKKGKTKTQLKNKADFMSALLEESEKNLKKESRKISKKTQTFKEQLLDSQFNLKIYHQTQKVEKKKLVNGEKIKDVVENKEQKSQSRNEVEKDFLNADEKPYLKKVSGEHIDVKEEKSFIYNSVEVQRDYLPPTTDFSVKESNKVLNKGKKTEIKEITNNIINENKNIQWYEKSNNLKEHKEYYNSIATNIEETKPLKEKREIIENIQSKVQSNLEDFRQQTDLKHFEKTATAERKIETADINEDFKSIGKNENIYLNNPVNKTEKKEYKNLVNISEDKVREDKSSFLVSDKKDKKSNVTIGERSIERSFKSDAVLEKIIENKGERLLYSEKINLNRDLKIDSKVKLEERADLLSNFKENKRTFSSKKSVNYIKTNVENIKENISEKKGKDFSEIASNNEKDIKDSKRNTSIKIEKHFINKNIPDKLEILKNSELFTNKSDGKDDLIHFNTTVSDHKSLESPKKTDQLLIKDSGLTEKTNLTLNTNTNFDQKYSSDQSEKNFTGDSFTDVAEQMETENNLFNRQFTLNLKLEGLNMNVTLTRQILNMTLLLHNTPYISLDQLRSDISEILKESGFDQFNLRLKTKEKKNYIEENYSTEKETDNSEINVKV
ncbi:hypothetical protein [Persephonella sp.]